MHRLVEEAHSSRPALLAENRGRLDCFAAALIEHETLDEDRRLRRGGSRPRLQRAGAARTGGGGRSSSTLASRSLRLAQPRLIPGEPPARTERPNVFADVGSRRLPASWARPPASSSLLGRVLVTDRERSSAERRTIGPRTSVVREAQPGAGVPSGPMSLENATAAQVGHLSCSTA